MKDMKDCHSWFVASGQIESVE